MKNQTFSKNKTALTGNDGTYNYAEKASLVLVAVYLLALLVIDLRINDKFGNRETRKEKKVDNVNIKNGGYAGVGYYSFSCGGGSLSMGKMICAGSENGNAAIGSYVSNANQTNKIMY